MQQAIKYSNAKTGRALKLVCSSKLGNIRRALLDPTRSHFIQYPVSSSGQPNISRKPTSRHEYGRPPPLLDPLLDTSCEPRNSIQIFWLTAAGRTIPSAIAYTHNLMWYPSCPSQTKVLQIREQGSQSSLHLLQTYKQNKKSISNFHLLPLINNFPSHTYFLTHSPSSCLYKQASGHEYGFNVESSCWRSALGPEACSLIILSFWMICWETWE